MKDKRYDVVEKSCYECDPFHAPYRTISAESVGKAKVKYLKIYSEYKFINILVRNSRKGSYN